MLVRVLVYSWFPLRNPNIFNAETKVGKIYISESGSSTHSKQGVDFSILSVSGGNVRSSDYKCCGKIVFMYVQCIHDISFVFVRTIHEIMP